MVKLMSTSRITFALNLALATHIRHKGCENHHVALSSEYEWQIEAAAKRTTTKIDRINPIFHIDYASIRVSVCEL